MITYCSISAVRSMKLCSMSNGTFIIEYCLRQPNYVLASRHLKHCRVAEFDLKWTIAVLVVKNTM